jgi:hypothetical protein
VSVVSEGRWKVDVCEVITSRRLGEAESSARTKRHVTCTLIYNGLQVQSALALSTLGFHFRIV